MSRMECWCCNYRWLKDSPETRRVICLGESYEAAHRWFNAPHADIEIFGKLWDCLQ